MAYDVDTRAEARRLIVWEGYTAAQASDYFDGAPAESTLHNWAQSPDDLFDGRTWYEERDRLAAERYDVTRPEEMADKVLRKIHEVVAQPGFDAKRADMLSKLSSHLRHFVNPKYHLSMTYQVLTRLVKHLQREHPTVMTEDLARAIRDFKTHERQRLNGD